MRSFFKTNCRDDFADRFCDLGNVCALFAQLIGFTAILPQVYQVWNYQSVDALHVLWPTALVTASIANAFYIFATERRAIFHVTAVYYPVVYILFLLEFWFYTRKSSQRKLSYAALCFILWACLLTIEISVPLSDGPEKLEWVTIVLQSIKVLPQLMLNIQLRTTFGQSSISVLLYCLVSTFNYLAGFLLRAKLQYRVMDYMASSLSYINAIQVLWYPKPMVQKQQPISYGAMIDSQDYSIPFEERNETVQQITEEVIENPTDILEYTTSKQQQQQQTSSKETSITNSSSIFGHSQTINVTGYFQRFIEKLWWQKMLLIYLLLGLIGFTVGLGITADTFWAIFGPLSMFGLLFMTSLHRDYNEGSLNCYFFTEIKYRILGDSL